MDRHGQTAQKTVSPDVPAAGGAQALEHQRGFDTGDIVSRQGGHVLHGTTGRVERQGPGSLRHCLKPKHDDGVRHFHCRSRNTVRHGRSIRPLEGGTDSRTGVVPVDDEQAVLEIGFAHRDGLSQAGFVHSSVLGPETGVADHIIFDD